MTGLPARAAAPPTSENAYCGKGDVVQFGAKDGPAELPKTCYYTAVDGTPSPGKQIHVAANANLATVLDGAHVIAIINSYIHGLNCIARKGKCTDATAVGGGHSTEPLYTFKIYNNFLESSGENILFGGSAASAVSTDIEIRRNHLFRPMLWKEGEPGYTPSPAGTPYIVKNNFELKSAIRVLFEANLLENSWGGFSQNGFSILLSPRNQSAQCPVCRVTDVTVRFNRVRNVAAVFQISDSPSKEGAAAADGGRYSIHDIIADNVHGKDYKGHGGFMLFVSWQPPVHDVQIDHVTAFVPGVLLAILNPNAKLENFTLTNSVFSVGDDRQPVVSAGGGPDSCASRAQKLGAEAILKECFSSYKFDKNLIIGSHATWPAGILTASSPEEAGIHDVKSGMSKDPRLCHEKGPNCPKKSPGAGAADGRDLGADVDAVEAAIAGVE